MPAACGRGDSDVASGSDLFGVVLARSIGRRARESLALAGRVTFDISRALLEFLEASQRLVDELTGAVMFPPPPGEPLVNDAPFVPSRGRALQVSHVRACTRAQARTCHARPRPCWATGVALPTLTPSNVQA
jgi:hypothetical protein